MKFILTFRFCQFRISNGIYFSVVDCVFSFLVSIGLLFCRIFISMLNVLLVFLSVFFFVVSIFRFHLPFVVTNDARGTRRRRYHKHNEQSKKGVYIRWHWRQSSGHNECIALTQAYAEFDALPNGIGFSVFLFHSRSFFQSLSVGIFISSFQSVNQFGRSIQPHICHVHLSLRVFVVLSSRACASIHLSASTQHSIYFLSLFFSIKFHSLCFGNFIALLTDGMNSNCLSK